MNVLGDLVKRYSELMPNPEDVPEQAYAEIEEKRLKWSLIDSGLTAAMQNLENAEFDLEFARGENDSAAIAQAKQERDDFKRDLELAKQDEQQARDEYLATQTRWGF